MNTCLEKGESIQQIIILTLDQIFRLHQELFVSMKYQIYIVYMSRILEQVTRIVDSILIQRVESCIAMPISHLMFKD